MRTRVWGLVGLSMLAISCATTRYEEFRPPPGEEGYGAAGVDSVVVTDGQMLQAKVRALEARIANLENQLEARPEDFATAQQAVATRVTALADQIGELERTRTGPTGPAGTVVAPAEPVTGNTPSDGTAPRSSESLNVVYEKGLRAFDAQQYDRAARFFREILSRSPGGRLADNAQYWLGECAYAVEDYTAALEAFKKVFQFTDTEKDDDAQLKLGYTYRKLGDPDSALIEFKRLTVDYPESEYLPRAEEQIRRIRAEKASQP